MSILIVDDSPIARFMLAALLKSAGYTGILPVASAAAALLHLKPEAPADEPCDVDLMLVDLLMPEMNGIELCGRIKQVERLRDIPIIMITASSEDNSLQEAFANGVNDYILKPPSKIELLARVRSTLKLKAEMDRRKLRERELDEKNRSLERVLASLAEQHRLLQEEQGKSEELLLNILPQAIAQRLKLQTNGVIAEQFPEVTVLFADIVDFTALSSRVTPSELVSYLNEVFSLFDQLAEKHGLEKIKTIGDAYMVVGGLPLPRADHIEAVADMALDILAQLAAKGGDHFRVRIGIHCGPVIAGVIGMKKFSYDLWGDTVNIASRMQEFGMADKIQVTPQIHARLQDKYEFEKRGLIQVKGMGEMNTYFLLGRKH